MVTSSTFDLAGSRSRDLAPGATDRSAGYIQPRVSWRGHFNDSAFAAFAAQPALDGSGRASTQAGSLGRATYLDALGCFSIVAESSEHAYVLFHFGIEDAPRFEEPRIATVERTEREWRLVLDPYGEWGVPGFRNMAFFSQLEVEVDDEDDREGHG